MPRLADLIRCSFSQSLRGFLDPPSDGPDGAVAVRVVVADNVCEHYFNGPALVDGDPSRGPRDYDPPWPLCFVEMCRPERTSAAGAFLLPDGLPERWGWRLEATTRAQLEDRLGQPGCLRKTEARLRKLMAELGGFSPLESAAFSAARQSLGPDAAAQLLPTHLQDHLLADRRFRQVQACQRTGTLEPLLGRLGWLLDAQLVVEHGGLTDGPVARVMMVLDEEGRVLDRPHYGFPGSDPLPAQPREALMAWSRTLLGPALWTVSLLHDAGVTTRRVVPPASREGAAPAPLPYLTLDLAAVTRTAADRPAPSRPRAGRRPDGARPRAEPDPSAAADRESAPQSGDGRMRLPCRRTDSSWRR